jgi:hypothetical protein
MKTCFLRRSAISSLLESHMTLEAEALPKIVWWNPTVTSKVPAEEALEPNKTVITDKPMI